MCKEKPDIAVLIPTDDKRLIGTGKLICSEQYETEAEVRYIRRFGQKPPGAIFIFKELVEEKDDALFQNGEEKGCTKLVDMMAENLFCHFDTFLVNWHLFADGEDEEGECYWLRGIRLTNCTTESGRYVTVGPLNTCKSDDTMLVGSDARESYVCYLDDCNFPMQELLALPFSGHYLVKKRLNHLSCPLSLDEGTAVLLLGKTGSCSIKRLYYRLNGHKSTFVRTALYFPDEETEQEKVTILEMFDHFRTVCITYLPGENRIDIQKAFTAGMTLYALNINTEPLKLTSIEGDITIPPGELADISFMKTRRNENV